MGAGESAEPLLLLLFLHRYFKGGFAKVACCRFIRYRIGSGGQLC